MDNSTPEPPKEDLLSSAEPPQPTPSPQPIQPQVPPQPQPQPPSTPTGPLMPGQVIGAASGATPSSPISPQPVSQPSSAQPVVGNLAPEPMSPQTSKKKWLLPLIIAVVAVVIALVAVFFLRSKNKSDNNTPSSPKTSQASNSSLPAPAAKKDETSSWKTYSDSLIMLKYPSGWTIKQDPNADKGNLNVTPPGASFGGYLGEDNFTDNAKTHDSKTYWQTAYNSDGSEKIVAENSDPVNGYDTYNVEVKDSTGSTTYSIVGKIGIKIAFYYPTNDKNNDTYEKIVSTIHIK